LCHVIGLLCHVIGLFPGEIGLFRDDAALFLDEIQDMCLFLDDTRGSFAIGLRCI